MIEKMLSVSIKSQAQPIHWHDLLEINLVLEGAMNVVRNNRSFHVDTGEMILLNRDDVHSVSSESENLLYAQIHMDLKYYNQYISDIWTVLFYCSPEDDDIISQNLKTEMKSHIASIVNLMGEQGDKIDSENKIIYYCIDILSSLKMSFVAATDQEAKKMSEEQSGRIWKVIDYMYDNHNRKLTLHEVAQQIYVSDDYLSKLLKKNNGMGFEGFLSFIRSEMSIRLLLNTEMSITNISYECGFSAPKYYNAAFVKTYGCTPAEYRRNNKKNFLMEKQRETTHVIYDDGIDKSHVFKLLKKYEIFYGESNLIQKKVCIDIRDLKENRNTITKIKYPDSKGKDIWDHKVQRALAEVHMPCLNIESNMYIWEEKNAVKMLLINPDGSSGKEYIVQIEGLDASNIYVYCREKTPDIPNSLRKMINQRKMSELDRDIIDNIYAMTFEYGEIFQKDQVYMNIELKERQIAKVVFQKIK